MKHFFILGRNTELSKEEILSYLEARGYNYKELFNTNNVLGIETKEELNIQTKELGGTLALGNITFEGTEEEFEQYKNTKELIEEDKFTYNVWGNKDYQILQEQFKKEKKKAVYKHGKHQVQLQEGGTIELPNTQHQLILIEKEKTIYYGEVTDKYNSEPASNRDMNKPTRREELAISPRLANILINLAETKTGDTMLDPFCGVGGILQEAILRGIRVEGIDKDKKAIREAKKNLSWITKQYGNTAHYNIKEGNAKTHDYTKINAIATETPLGILLKKNPGKEEAKEMIRKFEGFITQVLQQIQETKEQKTKIALTTPVIGKERVNIQEITKQTRLKLHKGPIQEKREGQHISRDITVLY
jgi:tRNA G10  N-methylase Trm11